MAQTLGFASIAQHQPKGTTTPAMEARQMPVPRKPVQQPRLVQWGNGITGVTRQRAQVCASRVQMRRRGTTTLAMPKLLIHVKLRNAHWSVQLDNTMQAAAARQTQTTVLNATNLPTVFILLPLATTARTAALPQNAF